MNNKVLILGATGMLGHVVEIHLKNQDYEVYGTVREKNSELYFDVKENLASIKSIIEKVKPNYIINCIGILNKVAEDNKELAVLVNSYLPHYMDILSEEYDFKFIHISTDCVFDGKNGSYDGKSFRDAANFYGRSKALGELENDRNLTLRTSIIGPDINLRGIGLFQWFMKQEKETKGFSNVIWTGVTTIQLAKVIEKSMKENYTGLYNAVNNQTIDKYSLLKLFNDKFNRNLNIIEDSSYVSNKSLVNNSGIDFSIPSYEIMIEEMKVWVDTYQDLYNESLNLNLDGKRK